MKSATAEQASAFTEAMASQFGARIVRRSDAIEYAMIKAAVLELTRGLVDIEKYLSTYSFSLGPLVYLADAHADEPDRRMEIVTHECEHVRQFFDEKLTFAFLYLTEGEARAKYEAEAYASQLEFRLARGGSLPTEAELCAPIHTAAYRLDEAQKRLADHILAVRATQAVKGIYVGTCSKFAIAWLKDHHPGLLAAV